MLQNCENFYLCDRNIDRALMRKAHSMLRSKSNYVFPFLCMRIRKWKCNLHKRTTLHKSCLTTPTLCQLHIPGPQGIVCRLPKFSPIRYLACIDKRKSSLYRGLLFRPESNEAPSDYVPGTYRNRFVLFIGDRFEISDSRTGNMWEMPIKLKV